MVWSLSIRALTLAAAAISLIAGASCSRSGAQDATKSESRPAPIGKNIGVNVSTINFWDGSRPFTNLIYGSTWQSRDANGAYHEVPHSQIDSAGWVKFLPAGHEAIRTLYGIANADIVCRWQGSDHGSMQIIGGGGAVRQARTRGLNELRFHYASHFPREPIFPSIRYKVDPADYVRNLGCREADANPATVLDPTFLNTSRGFSVIRFMKWQTAVEANTPVSWATRNVPSSGDYLGNDGVPVEIMVALANKVGADPWFSMPWNADDDYVTRFAAYVRDNLAPGRRAYVEVSNEVWNGSYAVMRQAEREGIAEGLDSSQGPYGQAMYRYAEKTQHVMQLWSRVFSGRMGRLVRVVSTQNVSPFWSEQVLGYRGTAERVDALATAPYWMFGDEDYKGQSLDQIMGEALPRRLSESLDWAAKQKEIAERFGKRYIAYEGGQHVWLNHDDALVSQIERDPRMYELYKSYIKQWNSRVGDTLTLFTLTGGIGKAGFGLVEYSGQPDADAPKMRAVREQLH